MKWNFNAQIAVIRIFSFFAFLNSTGVSHNAIVNILREVTSGRGYSLVDCNRARVFTWVITWRNKFPCEEREKPMCGESKTPSTPRSGFTSANVSTSSFFFFALSRRRKTRFRFVRFRRWNALVRDFSRKNTRFDVISFPLSSIIPFFFYHQD